MTALKVWTFFYGSFINLDVLKKAGFVPERYQVARLSSFDITIRPLANLVPSDQHCVYGIVAPATHEQLRRLYDYAEHELGGSYLPQAVLVELMDEQFRPALCYIAPSFPSRLADDDYLNRIVQPAREYGFPGWYIARLETFRTGK